MNTVAASNAIFQRFALALAAVLALALSGCASIVPPERALAISTAQASGAEVHRLFVATTREEAETDLEMFNGERGDETSFATLDISVPPTHQVGSIEWPSTENGDPQRHFVTRDRRQIEKATFRDAIRRDIASKPRGQRSVLIFVHGYNTKFAEAVYRFAQIVHDGNYAGTPILFTWASRGHLVDYVYDRDSATAARDSLEDLIVLARNAGAERVNIAAHSMGSWVLLEALRQSEIAGHARKGAPFGAVVLASPDVDVDVFKSQMKHLKSQHLPMTVIVSRDDRALTLSQKLAGNKPRVGIYEDDKELAELGVVVVDITDIKGQGGLNHTKFAGSPEVVQLIGPRLNDTAAMDGKRVTVGDRIGTITRNVGGVVGATTGIVVTAPLSILGRP